MRAPYTVFWFDPKIRDQDNQTVATSADVEKLLRKHGRRVELVLDADRRDVLWDFKSRPLSGPPKKANKSKGAAHCSICKGPHVYKHGRP